MIQIEAHNFLSYVIDIKSYYGKIDMDFTRRRFEEDVNDVIARLSNAGFEIVDHYKRAVTGFVAVIVTPDIADYDVAYRFEFKDVQV